MADERFLVTGGTGCIGSWIVAKLLREDVPVVVLTAQRRLERLRLILTDAEFDRITFVDGDVNDIETLEAAARRLQVTRVIHLAGLQFPFCAADPIAGARVNVAGTVSAVRARPTPRDRPSRLREQRGRLRAEDRTTRTTGPAGRRALPDLALRRLQGRQRAGRPGLLGEPRDREHRPAARTPCTARAATRA